MMPVVLLILVAAALFAATAAWLRPPGRLLAALLLIPAVALGAGLLTLRTASADGFALEILTAPDSEDSVSLWNITYADGKSALEDAESDGGLRLLFARQTGSSIPGLPALSGTNAVVHFDDDAADLTIIANTTFHGQSAQLLVSASWDHTAPASDFEPEMAVVLRFENVDLSLLNSAWEEFPVELTNALVGFANAEHTLVPSDKLGTKDFFSDGIANTNDNLIVRPHGVALQAVLGDSPLHEGAELLGAVDAIKVKGTIGDAGVLSDNDDEKTTKGLDLTADVLVSTPPALADSGLELDTQWSLTIKANPGAGTYAATVAGNAKLAIGDADPFSFGASLAISYNKTTKASTFTLAGTVGDMNDVFGQEWFDLKQLKLEGKLAKANNQTTITAALSGDFSIATVPMKATLSVSRVSTGKTTISATITTTQQVDINAVATALGAPSMDDGFKVTLTGFGLYVSATSGGGSPQAFTIVASGGAQLFDGKTCAGGSPMAGAQADLLFRLAKNNTNTEFLIGAKLSGLTLRQLSCDIPFEWTLPDTLITVSNAKLATKWSLLDAPTKSFLQPVLCSGGVGTGNNQCLDAFEVDQGFNITAAIQLDDDLKTALEEIGIHVQGTLRLTGTLPILGGTTTALKVSLPAVSGGPEDVVASGAVELSIGVTDEGIKAKIAGTMGLRVARPNQATCETVAYTDKFQDGTCYDLLSLTVSIGIEATVGPPPSLTLSLSGTLSNWVHAFGEPNLTINSFAIELTVTVTAGDVSVGAGMGGQLVIGGHEITLAFTVEMGTTPPRILLTGFTAGSGRGFSLQEIVQAFAPDLDANALPPNFSVKNIWFAYGTKDNPTLCIRQGLYFSAELHLNDPDPASGAGTNPICGSAVPNNGDIRSCQPNQSSCLAAVLVDISPKGFKFYGAISGFDMGPVAFDGAEVLIEITPTKQHVLLEGGATLYDPIAYYIPPEGTDKVWASGYLYIEFKQNSGQVLLKLTGCALIGGTDKADAECRTSASTVLQAYIKGSIEADFTKPGIEFFENAKVEFEASLSAPALEKLLKEVEEELKPVADWFDNAGKTLEGTTKQVITDVQSQFCVSFNPDCESLKVAASNYKNAPAYLDAQMAATDRAIRDSAALNFYCGATFQWPVSKCVQGYRDSAKTQFNNAIAAAGGRERIALYGIDRAGYGGIKDADFDVWYVNPVHLKWPGSGAAPGAPGGNLYGLSICTAGPGQTVNLDDLTGPILFGKLEELDPTLAALFRSGDAQAQGLAADSLAQSDVDNGQFIADVKKLGATFDMGNPFVICRAKATFTWNGPDGEKPNAPNLVTSTDAWGGKSIVELAVTSNDGHANLALDDFKAALLSNLLEGGADALNCPDGTEEEDESVGLTFRLSATTLPEGSNLGISGTAAPGTTVAINFGDGGSASVSAAADGTWATTYLVKDGPRTNFITVTNGGLTAYGMYSVTNVAPAGLQITTPAAADEGASVSLTGTFIDPGTLDTQKVVIGWGDGSSTELTLAANERTFTATHTYVDDDPTLTPEDDYEILVSVTDKDGGTTGTTQTLAVRNVAPTDITLTGTTFGADESGGVDADGYLVVSEGVEVTYHGTFRDAGTADTHFVAILWPDGVTDGTADTWRDAGDRELVHFSFTHAFRDDHPATGTPSDLLDVRVAVDDDDSGAAEATLKVRVQNEAPTVRLDRETQAVQYSDPIGGIELVATDVRGFAINEDAWSETLSAVTTWQVDGGEWHDGLPSNLAFSNATCTYPGVTEDEDPGPAARIECTWAVTGIANVAPGRYTIRFAVTDDDTGVTTVEHVLVVEPEDAAVDYLGPKIVSAPSVLTGAADVELRAMVRDSSVVPGSGDTHPGNITNATVTFVDRKTGAPLCTAQVVRAFEDDTTTGVAFCTATFATKGSANSWSFDVGMVVGGWYIRDAAADDIKLVVQRPTKDEIHGNHFITARSTAGTTAPTDGTRINGNISHVGFNKNFTAISTDLEIEFSANGRQYRAVVTSIDSLGILRGAKNTTNTVEVEARVTLYDVTAKTQPVEVGSGFRLQLRYLDVHASSTPDTMALAIWQPDGLMVAATHWDTVTLSGIVLAGGQILVK